MADDRLCLPLIEPDVQISASGSRELFAGLLHELCHFSACSSLAGRAFAAISELPVHLRQPVRYFYPLPAITQFSVCLERISTTARLRSTPISGVSLLFRRSNSCPRRFGLPHFWGCAARRGSRLTRAGLRVSRSPFFPRHAISADTARAIDDPDGYPVLAPDDFAGTAAASSLWL